MTHRRGILWTSYEHTILALLYKQRQHLGAEYAMFFCAKSNRCNFIYPLVLYDGTEVAGRGFQDIKSPRMAPASDTLCAGKCELSQAGSAGLQSGVF